MADDFKTVFPRKYYKKFFDENVRPDNRSLDECRPLHLEVGGLGTADGSSLVTIGNTKIICGVVSMQWTITCELVCLDYDGCLYDACCLALMAALANTNLKMYAKIEDGSEDLEEQISYQPTKESKKLSLTNKFFATTFALWNSKLILFDPTKEEEDLSRGTITIVCSANSDEYFIQKPGGCELTDEQLNFCLKHSKKRTELLLDMFNEKLHSTDEQ
ncbi:hypothetical protein HELRODRAFT_160596 [Helobdella robusta]|uniref:Ribosomal RNA-processing protein 43 n=1 Tax=Helobdella robusta TaxID=6412 RepID=T1EQG7_HELRO|nr:hypothetical protein HELRODRAFT_160596 [Helobdella robusta]ESO06427.1 hypothetical protein HELRODRAFT_160596 [Helobdella robusta]